LAVDQGSIAEVVIRMQPRRRAQRSAHGGAGIGVGAWSVNPAHPTDLLASGLLAASAHRLDLEVLAHWIAIDKPRWWWALRWSSVPYSPLWMAA
jgi:hypothetical protein